MPLVLPVFGIWACLTFHRVLGRGGRWQIGRWCGGASIDYRPCKKSKCSRHFFTTKTRNCEKSKERRIIEKHDSFRVFVLSLFRD